jgi:hypothetical protein
MAHRAESGSLIGTHQSVYWDWSASKLEGFRTSRDFKAIATLPCRPSTRYMLGPELKNPTRVVPQFLHPLKKGGFLATVSMKRMMGGAKWLPRTI